MKKYLLLLPLIGLLLAGCGDNEQEESIPNGPGLPSGGTEVDLKNQEQLNKAAGKLADDIKITYESAMKGFEINGSFKADEFSVVDEGITLKGIDLAYNFDLKVNNIDKKLSEWQVSAEVSNFGGKIVLNEENPSAKKMFEASNVSFGIYLDKGIVYADFSNPAFKVLANSVIDYAVPSEKLDALHLIVDPLFNKVKLVNLLEIGISDEQVIPTVTDEMFLEMKTEILEGATELPEGENSPIAIFDYDKNALGILIQSGESHENMHQEDQMTYDVNEEMYITGDVFFSEEGNLSKVNLSELINNEYKENGVTTELEKISLSESFAFKYGTGAVSFPDFSTFVDSNFVSVISEIIKLF